MRSLGGIASVLLSYANSMPSFTHCASNSRHGTVVGAFALARLLMLMPVYRLRGYDIVHVHGAQGKSWVRKKIIMHWARLFGFKTIYHSHGCWFADYAEKVGVEKIRKELARCSAVVTLTPGWSEAFARRIGYEGARNIDNIVELPQKEHPKELHKPLTALFIGRMCAEKGLYDLIEALAMRKDFFENRLKVLVAGSGESERFMAGVREAGLENIVEYIGPVFGQDKEDAFCRADFVLLPSHFEGLPICILEGAVRSMPAIATTVGGVPEFIVDGKNGLLIPPHNARALADALAVYVEHPEQIKEQGAAAALSAVPNLPHSVVESLKKLYEDVDAADK